MGDEQQQASGVTASVWEILDSFDREWIKQPYPRLKPFLDTQQPRLTDQGERSDLLVEVVMADLEHRWKRRSGGTEIEQAPLETRIPKFPRIEDYLVLFRDLQMNPTALVQLVVHEFKSRLLVNDEPNLEDFLKRFPQHAEEIKRECLEILEKQRSDTRRITVDDGTQISSVTQDNSPVIERSTDGVKPPISREPPCNPQELFQVLEYIGVMTPGLWARFTEPLSQHQPVKAYLDKLVEAGVLTDYQSDRVGRGMARRLVVDDYLILDRIGVGGMGVVYRARHQTMERLVAIKVLTPAICDDEEAVKRFQREIRTAAKLSHPNIVMAFDARRVERGLILVMEFVDGGDLHSMVEQQGPLPWQQAVEFVRQVADGLSYAHQHSIVHRDVKPANLLKDSKRDVIKILDLGLARFTSSGSGSELFRDAELTATGVMMGTVDFMAPEQALDAKHVDHRCDIYSLGCTLYFLLTGSAMYPGDTHMKKILAHRDEPIPLLRERVSRVPPALDEIFKKMVGKEPGDRYDDMSQVVAGLQEVLLADRAAPPDSSPDLTPAGPAASLRDRPSLAHMVMPAGAVDKRARLITMQRWFLLVTSLVCAGVIVWRLLQIMGVID